MSCALCHKQKKLVDSHIIPKFFFDWLKKTSVTGKIRTSEIPQKREQDGPKSPLLCNECEAIFSVWEGYFSKNIFKPYVNKILDDSGNTQVVENLEYNDNLLRFIISIQFRILSLDKKENLTNKHKEIIKKTTIQWREYLLSTKESTGNGRSYMFFLTSVFALSTAEEYDPSRINWFIHRTSFTDIIYTHSRLGILAKLGPIIIYTSLAPNKAKGMGLQMIHKKGILDIKNRRKIEDKSIENYIFQKKYKVATDINFSEKQQAKIEQDWINKGENAKARKIFEQDLDIYMAQKEINKLEDE
jgi:hypothetical protein